MSIKFRCFQCHQMLKTSRAKAGAVVACPKCGVDLIVPEPPEPAPPPPEASHATVISEPATAPAPAPAEVLALRPEDIRAQVDDDYPLPSPTPTAPLFGDDSGVDMNLVGPPRSQAPKREPAPNFLGLKIEPEPIRPEPPARRPEPPARPESVPGPHVVVAPPPPDEAPPIELEPPPPILPAAPTSLLERPSPARHRDVSMPRDVVAAWSLFAILALVLAFIAGLLVGHFVWTAR
jgi:hypothetical protein